MQLQIFLKNYCHPNNRYETYPYSSRYAFSVTTTRLRSTWEIDFDWADEQPWAFRDEFGLFQENFGLWVTSENCSVIMRSEIISDPPEPDCNSCKLGDFYFRDYSQIMIDISNKDILDTQISEIEVTWEYAEGYDELSNPNTELNVDFMLYSGYDTWSYINDNARDYD